jgi:hypothetical protein
MMVMVEQLAEWRLAGETEALGENLDVAHKNTTTAVIVSLPLPGTNAAVDSVFSLVNALWIDNWNRLEVSTVKSIIPVKHHLHNYKCIEFHEFLLWNCWDFRTDTQFC